MLGISCLCDLAMISLETVLFDFNLLVGGWER